MGSTNSLYTNVLILYLYLCIKSVALESNDICISKINAKIPLYYQKQISKYK